MPISAAGECEFSYTDETIVISSLYAATLNMFVSKSKEGAALLRSLSGNPWLTFLFVYCRFFLENFLNILQIRVGQPLLLILPMTVNMRVMYSVGIVTHLVHSALPVIESVVQGPYDSVLRSAASSVLIVFGYLCIKAGTSPTLKHLHEIKFNK